MPNINSPGPLGNIMTRLAGLKNVRPRRVMPDADFTPQLEDVDQDVSGTAQPLPNFSNFQSPVENLPASDLGGELTAQSYDVRANAINANPEKSWWDRLVDYTENKQPETVHPEQNQAEKPWQDRLTDYFAPQYENTSIPEEAAAERPWQERLTDYFSPQYDSQAKVEAEPEKPWWDRPLYENEIPENNAEAISDITPVNQNGIEDKYLEPIKPFEGFKANLDKFRDWVNPIEEPAENVIPVNNEQLTQNIDKAMAEPWKFSAYGSAQQVANSPVLRAEFKQVTGTDLNPIIEQKTSKYEEAMKGVEDSLNGINTQLDEQGESIKQRILNNQATDSDKLYLGMALLMPLIIGGFFGKEAGLGALAGGAKGVADVLSGRQKNIQEDEKALLELNKQKGGNLEKLADINLNKAKNLPKSGNEHLVGLRKLEFNDPETGHPKEAYEILPGLVAKSERIGTEKGLERMQKSADELSDTKNYVDQVNSLTNDIYEVLTQLEDTPAWRKLHLNRISNYIPGSLSSLTQNVKWKGQEVPAGPLLDNLLGILTNQYAHAQDLGQLDRAAQSHMEKLISNPTKTLLTPKDVEAQILNIRNFVQNEMITKAKNKGFYPEFLIEEFEKENNPLFGDINQRQDEKDVEELINQAMQGEI